ncbi:MAG: DUF3168 domain-containing protein [Phycisphaerales bacterium]|nr:DUF3168 domain-containing protein [Phycisphaerales bacterium]
MHLKEAITRHLKADVSITSLVGQRVFPSAAPQKVPEPLIVYTTVSGVRDVTQDGLSGFMTTRIQFDCLASSALVASNLAKAVVASLGGIRGVIGGAGGVQLEGTFPDDEVDGYNDELELHATSVDITFQHIEE